MSWSDDRDLWVQPDMIVMVSATDGTTHALVSSQSKLTAGEMLVRWIYILKLQAKIDALESALAANEKTA